MIDFSNYFANYNPVISPTTQEEKVYYTNTPPYREYDLDDIFYPIEDPEIIEIENDLESGNFEIDENIYQQSDSIYKKPNSTLGEQIVDTARKYIGVLYKWGGNDPNGFDCSGLIQYAYKQNGIKIPRTSHSMGASGRSVSLNQAQPGDIIYTSSRGPSGGHVKMISKIENGKIFVIEASGRGKPVKEHELTNTKNIKSIRRIINAKKGSKLIRKRRYIK